MPIENIVSLAEKFPMIPFAQAADAWLESIKGKTIQQQLIERRITQFIILPVICTAGLGIAETDGTFHVIFNDCCQLKYGFQAIGHEIGHTFGFDITKTPPLAIVDQNSEEFMFDFNEEGEPNGFYIEDFCDAFSLRWMAINTHTKVKQDCSRNSMMDAFILMLSEASDRTINP